MNEVNGSKFVTSKWNIVNDNSKANCNVRNDNTEVLKSKFCDYNNAYILVRGDITVTTAGVTQVVF